MEKCLLSLDIREIQIKTIMHASTTRISQIKKTATSNVSRYLRQPKHLFIYVGICGTYFNTLFVPYLVSTPFVILSL